MQEEIEQLLETMSVRLDKLRTYLDLDKKLLDLADFEDKMGLPGFWDDQKQAQDVIARSNELKAWVQPFHELITGLEKERSFYDEAKELGEASFFEEILADLKRLEKKLNDLELKRMLSGELDTNNCFLSLNAGAGGTESCDWVSMLLRMYEKWALKQKFKVQTIDLIAGDVAGIKSVTIKIEGPFAYGYCKAEKGVHRLVRISPFDSNAKRHTSFAAVEVTPEIKDDIEIEISPDDIKVDTFRASGAGGQHVNTTDSAVRITHLPTKVTVSCQSERSQHQNKDNCLKILKSKLYELKVLEKEDQIKSLQGDKTDNAWGSQIRNYVFQPYCLVKDSRTGYETGNVEAMMDGELLSDFIEEYLKQRGGS